MRVLQVNAFHYLRGGVERAYFDESRWLTAAGHSVAQFAIQDPRNRESPTAKFFAPHADYGEHAPWTRQLGQLPRALWSAPAAGAMERLLREFRPEIAHIHAPSRYLTPSVLRALERARVPMVMTLHDFKPWCTNRTLFAHGAPCERCRGGRHFHAALTRCVQLSLAKSVIGAAEAYLHQWLGAYRGVRRWIAPSRFVAEKVVELGLDPGRVRVLPHGVDFGSTGTHGGPEPAEPGGDEPVPAAPYVLYAGRLSAEKGCGMLAAIAAEIAPVTLAVAGDGPLAPWLDEQSRTRPNLRRVGHLDERSLARTLAAARGVLVPSLFYETFCYAAAEALLLGKPVVGSRIGAIPELIEHEVTGLLAPPRDIAAWSAAARRVLDDPQVEHWAAEGKRRVAELGDPRRHVTELESIYREAAAG